ncbi:6-phosphogluconate dehydrogenase (decarboxylating) [Sporosarcina sp. P31]|nr:MULTISPECIES: decarboxylating 6-phosphogluconate dehydrogenase [unclassified Sporosarcina]PIC98569.1 6-phosphogluconate dehydrogenase (decarboxylating) [Sporosarcina sp. P29]PID05996.1 6-phosphogluconate dehydrogenase (decarboxylating) [Sporosarcina sp. P30]PID09190.1 6-phosphogluconate dehydrogenase (decarboxylating) [Sporosarcina sp. P31]PID12488.1 6-phosphogluconate dehydrogenase (decarboxylating) [Sporosarcina sp. P32b]
MKIALIGLGKMGRNLAINILRKGYSITGYDILPQVKDQLLREEIFQTEKFKFISEWESFIQEIKPEDIILILIPHGEETELMLEQLLKALPKGSTVLECGNSYYKEIEKWNEVYLKAGLNLLDVGTSGGIDGAREGLCAMIGGNHDSYKRIEPFLIEICCEGGLLYTGKTGSGHYLKMIHNGIEYGMMQAIAEGFEVLNESPYPFDYKEVARLWNNGSVIRSWLMELVEESFRKDPRLESIVGKMNASGEAQWMVEEAMDLKVPVPVTALSLMVRNRSMQEDTFSGKVVAALRKEFGGHEVEGK